MRTGFAITDTELEGDPGLARLPSRAD